MAYLVWDNPEPHVYQTRTEGFEPSLEVLETPVLPFTLRPYYCIENLKQKIKSGFYSCFI